MQIKIIAVGNAELKTGKNGKPYSAFELTFKDLDKNTTKSKLIMSFDKKVYEILQASQSGEVFDITTVKSGEYWNWTDAKKGTEVAQQAGGSSSSTGSQSAYSNFNNDSRQLTIIRQSTLKAAVDWCNSRDGLTLADVYNTAKEFQEYVLNPDFNLDTVTEENDVE
jgi:hypothetical protein